MNKTLTTLITLAMIVPTAHALIFYPFDCEYTQTPTFGAWHEDGDTTNDQEYCLHTDNETSLERIYIHQDPFGGFKIRGSFDFWIPVTYTQTTGNIRNVNLTFKYYYPDFSGACLAQTPSPNTVGGYLSPQAIYVTNSETNFTIDNNFNAAFYQFNNEIVCNQERTFTHKLSDFTNEFGSSFTGNSKQLRRLDFETSMMYVWDIKIIGQTTEQVW